MCTSFSTKAEFDVVDRILELPVSLKRADSVQDYVNGDDETLILAIFNGSLSLNANKGSTYHGRSLRTLFAPKSPQFFAFRRCC